MVQFFCLKWYMSYVLPKMVQFMAHPVNSSSFASTHPLASQGCAIAVLQMYMLVRNSTNLLNQGYHLCAVFSLS